MGEAKRRANEIQNLKSAANVWRASLTKEEQIIAQLAERIDERIVRGRRFSGGCYHLAFFMTQHLANLGIKVVPVVGWVNDGLWKGVTSHAWIEYNGKKTDASLTYCEHEDAVPTGALIIQDFAARKGEANYSYHRDGDPVVVTAQEWMLQQPELRAPFNAKQYQHAQMQDIASNGAFEFYLENAPPGGRYADLLAQIR